MAETRPGGLYLASDGQTFIDANGNQVQLEPPTQMKAPQGAGAPPQGPQAPAGSPQGAETTSELPEDFPGREALIEAGYTTLEAVRSIDFEQTKVPGVGKATIAKIEAYFGEE